MKKYYFISILVSSLSLNGQIQIDSLLDEVSISINNSKIFGQHQDEFLGYGFSLRDLSFKSSPVNLVAALDYNRINHFYSILDLSRHSHSTDVSLSFHLVSISIGARYSPFKNKIISVEPGLYIDHCVKATKTGTPSRDEFADSSDIVIGTIVNDYTSNINISDVIGLYLAFNFQIPIYNDWIFIRPEIKYRINRFGNSSYLENQYIKLSLGYRFR
jgi:hypothetical protein